jgi:hypothetical protein
MLMRMRAQLKMQDAFEITKVCTKFANDFKDQSVMIDLRCRKT